MKQSIEQATDLLPEVIANTVADRTIYKVYVLKEDARVNQVKWNNLSKSEQEKLDKESNKVLKDLTNILSTRAEESFKNNPQFNKGVKQRGNKGRDYLYMFMQHWADAWVLKTEGRAFFEHKYDNKFASLR